MSAIRSDSTLSGRHWIILVIACTIAFGILMVAREQFHPIWLRAIIAACAFALPGVLFLQLRKTKS